MLFWPSAGYQSLLIDQCVIDEPGGADLDRHGKKDRAVKQCHIFQGFRVAEFNIFHSSAVK